MIGEYVMKKILFMVSSMSIGGVEKSLLSLLSAIPKEKYEITILFLEKKGGFLEYIPDWVKAEEATWFSEIKPIIVQSPQDTIMNYFNKKQYTKILSFIFIYLLSKYCNDRFIYYKYIFKDIPNNINTYDAAISYQGPTDIIDYYIVNKVKAKKKISWVHFDVSKFLINKKLYSKLYSKFNKIFVVSEEARKCLIERIPTSSEKAEVFLNIVSSDLINKMAETPVEFDNNFMGIKVVTVGRLSIEKGQDMAIKVLSRLRRGGYEVRWYCVGDGNNRKEYEILIEEYNLKDNFILLGSTPNPYPYIAKADIYVQTSRHEGFCLTLAEAKCLNKPIVTTNFTGAYEQITDGYNGLISGCTEEELYNKIKYLIENKLQRQKLTKNLLKTNMDTTAEVYKLFSYIQ
jgi:glycosyltransferase involved in cell wall biosynthesis